jgi:hypothetical protein
MNNDKKYEYKSTDNHPAIYWNQPIHGYRTSLISLKSSTEKGNAPKACTLGRQAGDAITGGVMNVLSVFSHRLSSIFQKKVIEKYGTSYNLY